MSDVLSKFLYLTFGLNRPGRRWRLDLGFRALYDVVAVVLLFMTAIAFVAQRPLQTTAYAAVYVAVTALAIWATRLDKPTQYRLRALQDRR